MAVLHRFYCISNDVNSHTADGVNSHRKALLNGVNSHFRFNQCMYFIFNIFTHYDIYIHTIYLEFDSICMSLYDIISVTQIDIDHHCK